MPDIVLNIGPTVSYFVIAATLYFSNKELGLRKSEEACPLSYKAG